MAPHCALSTSVTGTVYSEQTIVDLAGLNLPYIVAAAE